MKRGIVWSMLLTLATVLVLMGSAEAQQPKAGGTLRVAWEQDVTGFDPHWTPGVQVQYIAGNLSNSLLTTESATWCR